MLPDLLLQFEKRVKIEGAASVCSWHFFLCFWPFPHSIKVHFEEEKEGKGGKRREKEGRGRGKRKREEREEEGREGRREEMKEDDRKW